MLERIECGWKLRDFAGGKEQQFADKRAPERPIKHQPVFHLKQENVVRFDMVSTGIVESGTRPLLAQSDASGETSLAPGRRERGRSCCSKTARS